MKALFALLLYFAGVLSTVLAILAWFDHSDHEAIGYMFLTNALIGFASMLSASVNKRRRIGGY